MMARRRTVFSFSLHFAPFLSKLSGKKTPESHRIRINMFRPKKKKVVKKK